MGGREGCDEIRAGPGGAAHRRPAAPHRSWPLYRRFCVAAAGTCLRTALAPCARPHPLDRRSCGAADPRCACGADWRGLGGREIRRSSSDYPAATARRLADVPLSSPKIAILPGTRQSGLPSNMNHCRRLPRPKSRCQPMRRSSGPNAPTMSASSSRSATRLQSRRPLPELTTSLA